MDENFEEWLDGISEKYAKKLLAKLIEKLDDLDEDDVIGTEGWREVFNMSVPRYHG